MSVNGLQDFALCDMLNDDRVIQSLTMVKHEKVLKIHPFKITPPAYEGGRWQTYVKNGDKRKLVRTSTRELLLSRLFEYYYASQNIENLTLKILFPEWIAHKEKITSSESTIRRHEQHWRKYFIKLPFVNERLSSFRKPDLQETCNLLIRQNNLSSKEWQNIKTILLGMFEYAFDRNYIPFNVMKDVKITVKFRQVNKKSGSSQTYQSDEYKRLMNYLVSEYQVTGDVALLAVKFNFMLGLRVGELVSLRWSDIVDSNKIHICREEIKASVRIGNGWKDAYEVVEHTKTHSDRTIMLVPRAIDILSEIKRAVRSVDSDEDYIFIRSGERLTSRQVNYVLEKGYTKLGIPIKSSHKIRKTVASRLNTGNVPLDAIREHFGHSDLKTTLGYIYNPLTEKETYELMSSSL